MIVSKRRARRKKTKKSAAEAALQRAAEINAFRVALADALRPLADPITIQEVAARMLGQYLGASRVLYGEVADNHLDLLVERNYVSEDQPLLTGRFRMAEFGKALVTALTAGQTLVVPDIATAAELSAEERRAYAAIGIAALAGVPLVKDGRFVANLAVHQATPRPWTAAEVKLIEETAERTWAAVARARAEAALRESEERLQKAVSIETVGVLFFRLDGCMTGMNEAFTRMSGYSRAELLNMTHWDILTPPEFIDVTRRAFEELAARGETRPYEQQLIRKDGSRWWGLFAPTRLSGSGNNAECVEFIIDITESKRAEDELEERVRERTRELRQSEAQLRRLASRLTMVEQEERRRIAQILHDDLQQLLFGVQLRLGIISQSFEPGKQMQLQTHAQQAIAWIDDILTLMRQLTVDLSPPLLEGEGLTEALSWLVGQMKELYGLHVQVEAAQHFPVPDKDIRALLFQIIRELLFNVVKHAQTHEATVALDIEDERLVIQVRDKGRGFAAEAGEAGLGLRTIRERLDLFGGRMEIASQPGEGTTITVYTPVAVTPVSL